MTQSSRNPEPPRRGPSRQRLLHCRQRVRERGATFIEFVTLLCLTLALGTLAVQRLGGALSSRYDCMEQHVARLDASPPSDRRACGAANSASTQRSRRPVYQAGAASLAHAGSAAASQGAALPRVPTTPGRPLRPPTHLRLVPPAEPALPPDDTGWGRKFIRGLAQLIQRAPKPISGPLVFLQVVFDSSPTNGNLVGTHEIIGDKEAELVADLRSKGVVEKDVIEQLMEFRERRAEERRAQPLGLPEDRPDETGDRAPLEVPPLQPLERRQPSVPDESPDRSEPSRPEPTPQQPIPTEPMVMPAPGEPEPVRRIPRHLPGPDGAERDPESAPVDPSSEPNSAPSMAEPTEPAPPSSDEDGELAPETEGATPENSDADAEAREKEKQRERLQEKTAETQQQLANIGPIGPRARNELEAMPGGKRLLASIDSTTDPIKKLEQIQVAAVALESQRSGEPVTALEKPYFKDNGDKLTQTDVETKKRVIEVKGKDMSGARSLNPNNANQMTLHRQIAAKSGREHVWRSPSANDALARKIEKKGGTTVDRTPFPYDRLEE